MDALGWRLGGIGIPSCFNGRGFGFLLGLFLSLTPVRSLAQRADSVVTFNEIHYHPASDETPEWIELHNQMAVRVDLSGWRIDGGITYQFGEGAVIEPGAFWVIASEPDNDAFAAVDGVFGPFDGKLSNGGEHLVLIERSGRVMDEVEYDDEGKWPCAPDGEGPTLAKIRQTYSSGMGRNWTWSLQANGTPGAENFGKNAIPERRRQSFGYNITQANEGPSEVGLRLSEYCFNESIDEPFVELVNISEEAINLGDYNLAGEILGDIYLGAKERYVFTLDPSLLGLEVGDVLSLFSGNGAVLDSVKLSSEPMAFDFEKGVWQRPSALTPMSGNAFHYQSAIVINEINYHSHPVYPDTVNDIKFEEDEGEWIELYNNSDATVDLSGWELADAVDYKFPEETVIEPRGFLVITNDAFERSLSNRSDCVQLIDLEGNLADVVEYFDDRPWPKFADGGGSTLELLNPSADNSDPVSWAASDESGKSEWREFRYRGLASYPPRSNFPKLFDEFLMGMLDDGEVYIDDLSLVEDPDGDAIELIQNGGFENDPVGELPANWRILGNHGASEVVQLSSGDKVLHLISSGSLEHSYNIASTTFAGGREMDPQKIYEISFRAKWVGGSPQLNTRLYFNQLARTHILEQPDEEGTPGSPNSVALDEAPPSILSLRHSPLVPSANEPTAVEVEFGTQVDVSVARLYYDAGDGWGSEAMELLEGGVARAVIPGKTAGTVVQFYVEAETSEGGIVRAPSAGPDSGSLYRVGDRLVWNEKTHFLRLILPLDQVDFMHLPHHVASEQRLRGTLIYNDEEVWYDVGIRLRGSPFSRTSGRLGWNVRFPTDRLFRGVHETLAIDGGSVVTNGDGEGSRSGPGISTNELIYNQMAHRAGDIPSSYDDVSYIEAPGTSHDKYAQLKMARFGDIWKASSYEDGDDGTSFKLEVIYHPEGTIDGTVEGLKDRYSKVTTPDIIDMGDDKEAYRYNFEIQDNRKQDDFSGVIAAGKSLTYPDKLREATSEALDVDNWLRVMALQALTTTIDSYNNGLPHNMILYKRPTDDKVMWVPWDVDLAFFNKPDSSLFGQGNGRFSNVIQLPENRRRYFRHLYQFCMTGFDPSYINPWIDHYNDVSNEPKAAVYKEWIAERRIYVLQQIQNEYPRSSFQVSTNSGNGFSVEQPYVQLNGLGWIDIDTIRLGSVGPELSVSWLEGGAWVANVPLSVGDNTIELVAYDALGNVLGKDTIQIRNTSQLELANAQNLAVSELMYNPRDPSDSEIAAGFDGADDFEFIELLNRGDSDLDLKGVYFADGVDFGFSVTESFVLPQGKTVLVVRNKAAIIERYGQNLLIAGEFENDTGLSNGGESIRIEDSEGALIAEFEYDDGDPWPEEADGDGVSLELVDPFVSWNVDPGDASHWRVSAFEGGTPGEIQLFDFVGDPYADEDNDGMQDYLNFVFGGANNEVAPLVSEAGGDWYLSHRRNLRIDKPDYKILFSADLVNWTAYEGEFFSEELVGDGSSWINLKLPDFDGSGFFQVGVEFPESLSDSAGVLEPRGE